MCHLVNLQFQTGVMIGTHRVPEWAFHRCAAAKEQGRWHICGDGYKIVEQRSTDRDDCDDCWQHFRKEELLSCKAVGSYGQTAPADLEVGTRPRDEIMEQQEGWERTSTDGWDEVARGRKKGKRSKKAEKGSKRETSKEPGDAERGQSLEELD